MTMSKLKLSITALLSVISGFAISQSEPSKPSYEKQIYLNDAGDIFVQKQLPMYLKFSTEPNGLNYDLKGKKPEFSEPMYLDTEGPNYIRSKWAVDPNTGKTAQPQQEVLYEVNADGLAPVTRLKFQNAPKYVSGGTTFFGKDLSFTLTPRDAVSGVKATQYALGGGYSDYSTNVSVGKEGAQTLYYYSADFVGNAENTKSSAFTVDLTAPKTTYEVVGINKGENILSPTAKLKLASTDNLSGVKTTYYSFDGGSPKGYYGQVPTTGLSDGEHEFKYYAVDNVRIWKAEMEVLKHQHLNSILIKFRLFQPTK